jgi:hypothetical protein
VMHAKHADGAAPFIGQAFSQPNTCPDSSISSVLSACFACIAFLHLR